MKIQLLIATEDSDYAEHLSDTLSENYANAMDVSVCTISEQFHELLNLRKFDLALLEASMVGDTDLQSIQVPLLLWTDELSQGDLRQEMSSVYKYQRISVMVSKMLELYAKGTKNEHGPDSKRGYITAFWSPAGGVGKTTAALAYAAGRAAEGMDALYLDLEHFSSVRTYFADSGRSLSAVFEMLEYGEGSIRMLIKSICKVDNDSGISYLCCPENYDDVNILSTENIAALTDACASVTDELIIDMSCACDSRAQKIFDLADRIFIVSDPSTGSQIKLKQFVSQHNVFQQIKGKSTLINNKGGATTEPITQTSISLPLVQSSDPVIIYKTLSEICLRQL